VRLYSGRAWRTGSPTRSMRSTVDNPAATTAATPKTLRALHQNVELATNGGTTTGASYIVTASHCFNLNSTVNTLGGTHLGPVIQDDIATDSQIVRVWTNGDEGEFNASSGGYYPMTGGTAWTAAGDVVCQDGYYSYSAGYGVPCSIVAQVHKSWATTTADGTSGTSYGWAGTIGSGHWAAAHGDSGGLVFTYNGGNRQVRGIVSSSEDTTTNSTCTLWANNYTINGCTWVDWTQALSIYSNQGVKLNTSQASTGPA
jgi:hypothetical protein